MGELNHTMIDPSFSPAKRRANAAWLRSQITELTTQITGAVAAGKGHRWTPERVGAALRAITDREEHWQIKAADALRGGGR